MDDVEALAQSLYARDYPMVPLPLPSADNLAEAWLRERYIKQAEAIAANDAR